MVREDKATWKAKYFLKLVNLLDEYPKCFIVSADDVGSKQMQQIRVTLRGSGVALIGKNTMMRKAIGGHLYRNPALQKYNDVPILKEGDKVGATEATLLNMLNISPFSYGLSVQMVYDSGTIFEPKILDIKPEDLLAKFSEGIANLTAVCMSVSYPCAASVPHMLINGLKNLVALAMVATIEFEQAVAIEEFIKNPLMHVLAAAPVVAAAAPKDESEEEDDDMGFGLFD